MAKTSIDIPQLRFNKMSTAKYEELKQAGQLVDNEFYITPDVSSSDIPAISSSTNDYVLSNDGNQLNWIQESEYTKNRIDSKLNGNVITNCITKIPQDIKLELSEDGTLTLKQGSNIYKGDGTSITIDADLSITNVGDNGNKFLFSDGNGLAVFNTNKCICSETNPGIGYQIWYNTVENVIYVDGTSQGNFSEYNVSIPLAIITCLNNKATSIVQIFNGFSYIDNMIFALPGIEGLIPNGFDENNNAINNNFKTTSVLSVKNNLLNNKYGFRITNTVVQTGTLIYDEDSNFNYNGNIYEENKRNFCIAGYYISNSTGRIISFEPKSPIKLVDTQEVVHNTGDEEISGVKTFKDEITAPNQLDYTNITNCITKIPQDIKLELNDGTLTLKAGSKVYYGNGSVVNIDSDLTATSTNNNINFIRVQKGKLFADWDVGTFSSGTDVTGYTGWFFNTNDKTLAYYNNGVKSSDTDSSLPLGVVTVSGGKITSIDQIFNGFSYIGSTIFALPDVEGLIPNGRNADGSLNNVKHTTNKVLISGLTGVNQNFLFSVHSDGWVNYGTYELTKDNYLNSSFGEKIYDFVCGTFSTDSTGRITSFKPKTTFQVADINDTEWASTQSKPSGKYVDLTLEASGSSYTAPANGYFAIRQYFSAENSKNFVGLYNVTRKIDSMVSRYTNSDIATNIIVQKGDIIHCYYSGITTNISSYFRFIYDEGVK